MTIDVETVCASATAAREWDQWLASQDAPNFQQYWDYGAALESQNLRPQRIRYTREGVTVGQLQLMVRHIGPGQLQFLHYGPVLNPSTDSTEIAANLSAMNRPWRAKPLLWNPPLKVAPKPPWRQIITGGSVAIVQLDPNQDMLLRQLKQKWRNALHQAMRHDLKVITFSTRSAAVQALQQREDAQRKLKKYRDLPPHLPQLMSHGPGSAKAVYLQVEHQGRAVSEASFIITGATAFYFSGWTNKIGREKNAQHLLLFEACSTFAARGIKRLNLGGIDTVSAKGLARFKLGLGAEAFRHQGTYL